VEKYSIVILPVAQEDMKSIVAYIRKDNPEAALRMVANIRESIGRLASHPKIGSVPSDPVIAARRYRMLVVKPYLVFYVVYTREGVIEVHRVLHSRQLAAKLL
jgi:addiction module RelE/StbE family toxin